MRGWGAFLGPVWEHGRAEGAEGAVGALVAKVRPK